MKKQVSDRVVVITDRRDAHLPFVERHLDKPFIVLDPQEFVADKKLSYELIDDHITPIYDGLILNNISGVWYRKPLDITNADIPVAQVFKDYTRTAMQRHFNQLLTCFEDAIWISDYYNLWRANNKSWQLAIAKQLGMKIPATVMTSDRQLAEAFLKAHPRSVAKPITTIHPELNGETTAFFTTLIEKDFVPDLTNLHLAPAIFQEAIINGTDIRVTVVGEHVFAAAVHAENVHNNSRIYDFRIGHYEGEVTIQALDNFPKELARQCIEHTKRLGLRFGALDFVLDDKGTYWFLENNPNGQWGFVEQATGQPIGKAIAELLQSER